MRRYLLLHTIRKELFSFSSLFFVLITSILYICLATLLLNYRSILAPGTPLLYKINFFFTLIPGIWNNLEPFDLFLFVVSFLLVGLNMLLFYKTLTMMRHKGKIRLSIGGGTLLALATTGCMSCGISILSVLGLSASLTFLPFHGLELHILALILLLLSFGYMFWKLYRVKYCKIPS